MSQENYRSFNKQHSKERAVKRGMYSVDKCQNALVQLKFRPYAAFLSLFIPHLCFLMIGLQIIIEEN